MNGGGILGVVALENDLDPEEDVEISGDASLNFESEVRAVILDCENTGSVTVSGNVLTVVPEDGSFGYSDNIISNAFRYVIPDVCKSKSIKNVKITLML